MRELHKMVGQVLTSEQSTGVTRPIIFDRNGNTSVPAENNVLLVPDSLYELPVSFTGMKTICYRITGNTIVENPAPRNAIVLYAPFPLGLWAVHALADGHFAKLILDKREQYRNWHNRLSRIWLKNEKRRMGSDVYSPLMMRRLRESLSVADYFPLNIGDWIYFSEKLQQQSGQLSQAILWLDKKTSYQDVLSFSCLTEVSK